tara:strand:- start:315 stop:863 length:549 start_codon:yes stop_codon:yes gene_type:complete
MVEILSVKKGKLPNKVILKVPSGSEFNQSRLDLPPVSINRLEPVIMPSNDNFLVLDTDLENKLSDQIKASAVVPTTDQLGDALVKKMGQFNSSRGKLFQPQPNETRPILPAISKNLDSSVLVGEAPLKNLPNSLTNESIDRVEYDGTNKYQLEDFNPNLPTEPSVPILKATPIGDSMKKSYD